MFKPIKFDIELIILSRYFETFGCSQIKLKGKTVEKLGLIGKEKAIACEVISSITKYD